MNKRKEFLKKISNTLRIVFGYGILLSLFVGGMTFFGYIAALLIGGETASVLCAFLYDTVLPIVIKVSTVSVLLGLLIMYLSGEAALTPGKKTAVKQKSEM